MQSCKSWLLNPKINQLNRVPHRLTFSGNAPAREDAVTLARGLKHGAVMPGWDWGGWFVTIVDAHGHKIDEVPIADV
jgi:hypothetical protein